MSNREEENDWENDPVWDLVDQAQAPEANPLFVRNVMREVRLSSETHRPWTAPRKTLRRPSSSGIGCFVF